MTKKSTAAKSSPGEVVASHVKTDDGSRHLVGIGNLRVVLVEEDGCWFAQGLEIDYASQGGTLEEAKKRFETGLEATIDQNLRVFGSIDRLLRAAPGEVWQELLAGPGNRVRARYSHVSEHVIQGRPKFPFAAIQFLQREAA